MAAGAVVLYRANIDDLRFQDLVGATVRLHLISSSYTPSAGTSGHSVLADISTNEISGGGYSGGIILASKTVTASSNGWRFSTGNVSVTAAGGTIPAWRWGVLAVSGALWGKTDPVLGYFLGDNAPADVPATSDGATLLINTPANGWFEASHA